VAADAIAGKAPFKQKYDVKALFSMYGQIFLWFGRKASGVTSWDQIVGKKMAVGTPGGSTRVAGDMVVATKGLKGKAQFLYLRPASMIDSLRDGNIDAGFGLLTGNAPAPWVQEVMASLNVNFFGLDEPTIAKIVQKPGYVRFQIPAGILKGSPGFATFSEYLIAGVSAKMDEQTAYLFTKTIQDNLTTLANYSPAARGIKPADALKGIPSALPFHAGAIRYYKEKGLMK
jgi:TRAP transporter TAXI family solute receptor